MRAIAAAVAEQPVVVADGHHRYETSLAYKAEREAADGDAGEAGATLAYLVELVEDELTVHAIHRLLTGLPDGSTSLAALAPWFEDAGPPPADRPVTAAMLDAGCLTLVLPDREVLLRPRPDALAEARDLDSSRLDVALASLPTHELRFQHGVDHVRAAVAARRGPGRVCCSARSRSPRSRPPPTAASACRRSRRSSTPSPRPAWSSAASTERSDGASPTLPGGAAAQERLEVAGALRRDLLVDLALHLGGVLEALDGPEHADRRGLVGAAGQAGEQERDARVDAGLVVDEQGVLADVGHVDDAGAGLGVEHHAPLLLGAEPDRLAVLERDQHLVADRLGGDALEGGVVEDVAVLEDLDERGALVLVGAAERLDHVVAVHVVGAGHEARLGAERDRRAG